MSIPKNKSLSDGSNLMTKEERIPKRQEGYGQGHLQRCHKHKTEIKSNRLREVWTILE
jgi:hypothetical protein